MENYYKVNGVKLHVIEEGPEDGEVIIFLHGFPEFWYSWKKQIPYFSKAGFRVLVPDQRGYNLSDKPSSVKDYHIKELVTDVAELIGITDQDKVNLVGHDWGGIVAWKVAEQYPELIENLIIINIPHPTVFKRTLMTSIRQCFISSYAFFAQIPWLPEKILKLTNYKILTKAMSFDSKNSAFTAEDLEKYRESWKKKGSMKAMINWYRAAKYSGESKEDINIEVPALFIWGNQERFFIEDVISESLEMCENAILCRIDGTHWLHHEKPDEINKEILEFIH